VVEFQINLNMPSKNRHDLLHIFFTLSSYIAYYIYINYVVEIPPKWVNTSCNSFYISESLDATKFGFVSMFVIKTVGLVHCSQDPQVLFSPKTTLKLGPTTLFTHLKNILLQYFQFSTISGI